MTDVGAVIERMRAFRSDWPPGDGVAVFNQVYLTVTEALGRHITDGAFPERRPCPHWTCGSRSTI